MIGVHAHAAQVRVVDLCFDHGGEQVLEGISHTFHEGDRVGLVGRNGVGKSTLLQILAGRLTSTSGTVTVTPPQATVGLLQQELDPGAHQTMLDVLAERTGVTEAEAAFNDATRLLGEGDGVVCPTGQSVSDWYDTTLHRWLRLGGADFENRVDEALSKVGLGGRDMMQLAATLSGGEQAKLGLAVILLSRFDVLLLDEPTNSLDSSGIELLEAFLDRLVVPLVVVSHDRRFMAAVVNGVLEIDGHDHTARFVRGSWGEYQEARALMKRQRQQRFESYVSEREHLLTQGDEARLRLAKGVRAAKNHSDNDKSLRNRQLERTEAATAKAGRLDRAVERLEVVDKPWQEWELQFAIGETTRSGDLVAELRGASATVGDFGLGPIDLLVTSGERLAILGANGSGKSTLIRALLGTLTLSAGSQRLGRSVVVGELDQARACYHTDQRLLTRFLKNTGSTPSEARSTLAKFGLGSEHILRPGRSLSPGELTRAGLAEFQLAGVNLLVLDEPTNHLDLAAIEQLEQALDHFDGTLLLVSHDRAFLDAIDLTRSIRLVDGVLVDPFESAES